MFGCYYDDYIMGVATIKLILLCPAWQPHHGCCVGYFLLLFTKSWAASPKQPKMMIKMNNYRNITIKSCEDNTVLYEGEFDISSLYFNINRQSIFIEKSIW